MTYENSLKSIRNSNRLANRRTLTILGLSGLIVVHVLDLPSKIAEVPYLACAYGATILAAGILIERIASRDRAIDYLASAALALSVLVAFVINRTLGMPLATDDIGNQVRQMQEATRESVAAIQRVISVIGQVDTNVAGIAAAVEEQGAATREISRNVQEASIGTQQVTSSIGTVAAAADSTGRNAGEMLAGMRKLSQEAASLEKGVDTFLAKIRV